MTRFGLVLLCELQLVAEVFFVFFQIGVFLFAQAVIS